jgi:hypothetical protein
MYISSNFKCKLSFNYTSVFTNMWCNIYVLISWLFLPNSIWNNTLKSMSVYHVGVFIYTICVPVTNQELACRIIDYQCSNLPLVSLTKYGDELFFKLSVGRSLLLFSVRKWNSWNKVYRTIEGSGKDSLQVYRNPRNFIKLYPTLVLFEQSNCIDWQNLLYTVTDQDVVFLVPDSCWGTIRNGKIVSTDTNENV